MLNIAKTKKAAALLVAALGVVLAFGLAGCGGGSAASSSASASASASASGSATADSASATSGDNVIKVGASPTPHAEILNDAVAPLLEEAGYKLEVVEFTDYVLPNTATEDGELDANYFQHLPCNHLGSRAPFALRG